MITTKDITVGNYFYYHYSEDIPRDVCQIWDKQAEDVEPKTETMN